MRNKMAFGSARFHEFSAVPPLEGPRRAILLRRGLSSALTHPFSYVRRVVFAPILHLLNPSATVLSRVPSRLRRPCVDSCFFHAPLSFSVVSCCAVPRPSKVT